MNISSRHPTSLRFFILTLLPPFIPSHLSRSFYTPHTLSSLYVGTPHLFDSILFILLPSYIPSNHFVPSHLVLSRSLPFPFRFSIIYKVSIPLGFWFVLIFATPLTRLVSSGLLAPSYVLFTTHIALDPFTLLCIL